MQQFFPPNSGKDQKKRSLPKKEHFFSRIPVETCAQMHTRVKLLEGMQMSNYWGDTVKVLGEIYPPRVSAPLVSRD